MFRRIRDHAEIHFGLTELRFVARVDEVTCQRDLAPATERKSVDRSDHGETCIFDRGSHTVSHFGETFGLAGRRYDMAAMSAPAANAFSPAPVRIAARTLLD